MKHSGLLAGLCCVFLIILGCSKQSYTAHDFISGSLALLMTESEYIPLDTLRINQSYLYAQPDFTEKVNALVTSFPEGSAVSPDVLGIMAEKTLMRTKDEELESNLLALNQYLAGYNLSAFDLPHLDEMELYLHHCLINGKESQVITEIDLTEGKILFYQFI